jgi:hypothetical protein
VKAEQEDGQRENTQKGKLEEKKELKLKMRDEDRKGRKGIKSRK